MSWNNMLPASFLLDEAMEAKLPKDEYIEWLRNEVRDRPDQILRRRLYIMEHPEEFEDG